LTVFFPKGKKLSTVFFLPYFLCQKAQELPLFKPEIYLPSDVKEDFSGCVFEFSPNPKID